jgi:8-oxo-dGTP pyrophosphatase MutT (NUDIX family)
MRMASGDDEVAGGCYLGERMLREISAGGVVVRRMAGKWYVALIEPHHEKKTPEVKGKKPARRVTLCLPKGLVDHGETAEGAALREVQEETGVTAAIVSKLLEIKYVYRRSWGDGKPVSKVVSFYLMRYTAGRVDDIAASMRQEVERALWVEIEDAIRQLAYRGERQVMRKAFEFLQTKAEV